MHTKRWSAPALLVLAALVTAPCAPRARTDVPAPETATGLVLEPVARGLEEPLYATAPAGDPRLFIVEQPGRIRVVREGKLLAAPFLDLTGRVSFGGERGLLGLAFHPDYRSNGHFFVNYTDRSGDTRIERYTVGAHPDRADAATRRTVLTIHQPYTNHNGGHLLFGPDRMLYIGMGDGGGAGDPHGNSQDLGKLLGKMLRIDVTRGDPYAIPSDNPFRNRPGARPEIWALGLRNPWRYCFDPTESQLYIADVGQNRWEEIHVADAARGGLNYGWNRMEGAHCYPSPRPCDRAGLELPVVEYDHAQGCSITGGFVYRGRRMPQLVGHYFYADYCQGWVRSFRMSGGSLLDHREWRLGDHGPVLSFGTDAAGEMYLCSGRGVVFRLAPAVRR